MGKNTVGYIVWKDICDEVEATREECIEKYVTKVTNISQKKYPVIYFTDAEGCRCVLDVADTIYVGNDWDYVSEHCLPGR